jgi:CheY-like chemotaxis protein
MPKMGGRAVCDTLRAKNPDFPILLSSGYSTNAVHTGFVMQEGIDFLQKPYSPHVLLRKVREVLDKGKK